MPTIKQEGVSYIGQHETMPSAIAVKLREEAAANPVFAGICDLFSERQRSRRQLSLRTVIASLNAHGHSFERGEVARCFRFLAGLGIGELVTNANNQVEGLTHVKFALNVIADAALAPDKPGRLMTVDDVKPSQFIKSPKATDHIANVNRVPVDVKRPPSTTLAAPTQARAVRHTGNNKPDVEARPAVVTIQIGKQLLNFEVDLATAVDLIRQLD